MKSNPLSDTTVFGMIFVALLFDAAQAIIGWIPIFGNILSDFFSVAVFLIFFLWFKMYGISMLTPKRLRALAAGGVIEMIPYLNILPAWTGVVVYLIGTTKIQEIASKHPTMARAAMGAGTRIKKMNRTNESPNTPFVDNQ